MNPVIFQLGPFSLHWYGVFIVGGAVLAGWLSARNAERAGEDPNHIWNLLAWMLVAGIVGARIYHVLSSPADGGGLTYYLQHPLDAINFWSGGFRGLGIYGGVAGGLLALWYYTWRHRLNIAKYIDFIAINVLLAQAIGRMGNFVNQELYGPATNVPWAFHINPNFPCAVPENLPAGIQACGTGPLTQQTIAWYAANGFHPTFFYEAIWNLSAFLVLTWFVRRYGARLRQGDTAFLYLIAYSMGRFWVEAFRPDAWTMGTLATAQWIALGLIALGVVGLIWRHSGWSPTLHPDENSAYLAR